MLAWVVAYTDRVNISVAAVAMKEQLGWSETEKGLVLSAFFIGYLVFMYPAGLLATRFGGKAVLGLSVLAWSILTLVTPWAAMTSLGTLLLARVSMGVGEAGMTPAAYDLFGRWVPPGERARSVAVLLSGVPVGTVAGFAGSGWLVHRHGWPMAFYAFGAVGLLWVPLWFHRVQNDPGVDVWLDSRESNAPLAPPRRWLLRAPVVAIVTGQFATLWSLYVLLSWLPSYFRVAQRLTIPNAGLFSAAPWLAMLAMTNLAGVLSDRLIRGGLAVTRARKLMQCGGLVVSAAFLLATRVATTPGAALGLLCAATGALGCTWCGYSPAILDVAPRWSAVLVAFGNTIGTLPGIVGVFVTGWLVDVTGTYSAAFTLTAAVSLVGAVVFGFLFDARPLEERGRASP